MAATLSIGALSACAVQAPPDQVGLFYMKGPSDGNHFGHCVKPGTADDWEANNEVIWVPTSTRTWNIAVEGGDTNRPITVAAKPEENQPSGVQVNVWSMTNFALNTNCDAGQDSPVVQWWEKLGRRYDATTVEGWRAMLLNTVVPALETATRVVIRDYNADPLVAGINLVEVQDRIADVFAEELRRLSGGDFFCGPTFDRASVECPPVEVIVKDVDYSDPGIQEARNAKVKALELAAALVAEAEGKVRAAEAQAELYNNPAWVELEKARLQYEMVKACASNPNCTVVLGADGAIVSAR